MVEKVKRDTLVSHSMVQRLINQKYSNVSEQARPSVKLKELIKGRGQQRGPAEAFASQLRTAAVSMRNKTCLHHRLTSKSLEFN